MSKENENDYVKEVEKENQGSKKTASTLIIVLAILAVTAVIVFAILKFGRNKNGGGGAMGWGGGRGPQTATAVRTTVAKNQTITDFVLTNGEIETQKSIEVFPSIGGKVVDMKVSLGSPVKAGDVIAYIDSSEPGSYYAKSPVTAPIDGSIITSPVKIG